MIRRNSLVVEQWQKIHSHLLNMALTNDLLELGKDDHISVIFLLPDILWLKNCCVLLQFDYINIVVFWITAAVCAR